MGAAGTATVRDVNRQLRERADQFMDRLVVLEGTGDPLERARLASDLWTFMFHELQPAITTERRAAVRALRPDMTIAEIAHQLGVTDSRVSAICRGRGA